MLPALLALTLVAAGSGAAAGFGSSANTPLTHAAWPQHPLVFESNRGQTDPSVRFLARGENSALFLTDREAVLSLRDPGFSGPTSRDAVLRFSLRGASPGRTTGLERQSGTASYLLGRAPAHWQAGISLWKKVRRAGVYPGVDVVYYGNPKELEYDFEIAPGADPGRIRLQIQGANSATLQNGDLVMETTAGVVRQRTPVAYQLLGSRRLPVPVRYQLHSTPGSNTAMIGLVVGAYDRRQPLIIDPVLSYSTYLSSTGKGSQAGGIAVDAAGNSYVVGSTVTADFPGKGRRPKRGSDVFLVKIDPNGRWLANFGAGGTGNDYGQGVAVDPAGNIYLCGTTTSDDFPVQHALQSSYADPHLQTGDAFVMKLDARFRLQYSTYLGKAGPDTANGIGVDGEGNAYVTGTTENPTVVPPPPGAARKAAALPSGSGSFVAKLSADGSALSYYTLLSGGMGTVAKAIAADAAGSAYVAGSATTGFQATDGAFQIKSPDVGIGPQGIARVLRDGFAMKLSPDGSEATWATFLGGTADDAATSIAVGPGGVVAVAGQTASTDFPVVHAIQPGLGGATDAFIVKLRADGMSAVYSTYLGGSGPDIANSVAINSNGDVYVVGTTGSPDLPVTDPLPATGGDDVLLAGVVPDGSTLIFATRFGGKDEDQGVGIAVDSGNNLLVTGNTTSRNFPTLRAPQRKRVGQADAFAAKFTPSVPPPPGANR